MTKKFFSVLILFLIFIQTIFVDHSFAITAEERLEEVEKAAYCNCEPNQTIRR
ncbi:MAG: hypothetical protein Ct9H90mP10_09290 [Actinomycetota bacterium]|nr:MAG: hypothetical protein Ct9H90mP10_09290 [Actinomycetota bacterium]